MTKKKKIIWLCVGVLLLVLLFGTCVSVRIGYQGISICFFEKWESFRIDKIIVKADGKEIVITDPDLVSKIAWETTVATTGMVGCPEDRRIDAYCGDELVRSMKWSTCSDTIKVYKTDGLHWVFDLERFYEYGFVAMSDELVERINALLDAA
jgi:hypothetical protein